MFRNSWCRLRRAARVLAASSALAVASAQPIVVNELMTSNGGVVLDENGDAPDWFELLNASDAPVDLDGWGLTDNPSRPFKWVFRHAALNPGEILLVFASDKDRQPQPAAPLEPASLAGLRVWLRADAVDPNDPAQVRRAGSAFLVRHWTDRSGQGNHAVQTTDARQPAWVANGLGGKPVLRFDGVNDVVLLPRVPATNSFCLFAVARTSQAHETDPESVAGVGGVSGQRYLFGAAHGGDSNGGAGLSVGTNGLAVYEHGSGYMPALAVHRGCVGTGAVVVAVNYDAKQPTLGCQGLIVRQGFTSPRTQVTAPVEIGAGSYGAFCGDLAEVLVYDRPLSENEQRAVSQYLAESYGLVLPFPRHTNFQLSASGEELQVTRPDGAVVDHVAFGPIPRDVSYGRQPDATGPFLYFNQPTPGAANTTPGSVEHLGAVAFSAAGGFHASAVLLTLSVPSAGANIHYTLDGSDPVATSPRYTAPLALTNRTGTRNDLSAIPTVPGAPAPAGEVFKGWVVRARALKTGALPGPTVTRTFWIDAHGRSRYTLPVVSLATARANFFDPAIGIYVPGNAPGGNYSQRGAEWQRPVHVELYETDNSLAFAQDADVKIHGNTSQGFPIKGLDLDGTGGQGRQPFKYRIFPDRARSEFEHFLLRPTGHDQPYAFMRDELQQGFAAENGAESQAARACVVFVNGEYWGLHYLKEKEDAEFVAYYGDHPADDIDYLEGYAAPKAGDTAHYDALIAYLAANDPARPEVYAQVSAWMDVPNYIDYKVCEIFNYRWDIGNHRLWRPRTPEGRWRWLQFDNDVGWGGFWAEQPAWEFNMLVADLTPSGSLHDHNNETTTFLLRRLIDNAEFRRDFINRFADLLNTTFQPARTIAHVDRMAAVLESEMAEHTRRWRSPAALIEWQNHVEYLRTYAANRPGHCRQHLMQRFGLGGTATLAVGVSATNAGTVRLNSLNLASPATQPWQGVYFKGNPVRLTARPHPGYRFAGWDGLYGVTSETVTLLLNGDFTVSARFAPDPSAQPRIASIRGTPGGLLTLEIQGMAGVAYQLEGGDAVGTWTALDQLTANEDGQAVWRSLVPAGAARRFYRLRLP